uniref:DWNN domain-containing protein n=1 Tax=Salarias fasciatus TaxID=181472 RepID=A0A672HDT9_SALFA
MADIHYKFSSRTLEFDGLHAALRELKRQIMCRENLQGRNCDLQVSTADSKEGNEGNCTILQDDHKLYKTRHNTVGNTAPLMAWLFSIRLLLQ